MEVCLARRQEFANRLPKTDLIFFIFIFLLGVLLITLALPKKKCDYRKYRCTYVSLWASLQLTVYLINIIAPNSVQRLPTTFALTAPRVFPSTPRLPSPTLPRPLPSPTLRGRLSVAPIWPPRGMVPPPMLPPEVR